MKMPPKTIRSSSPAVRRILAEVPIEKRSQERVIHRPGERELLRAMSQDHGRSGIDLFLLAQVQVMLNRSEHGGILRHGLHLFLLFRAQHRRYRVPDFAA